MSIRRDSRDALRRLAERYGIAASYVAMDSKSIHPPDETLFAALRALGADVSSDGDVGAAYDRRRIAEWTPICDPTTAVWDGAGEIEVRLPSRHSTTDVQFTLKLEDGSEQTEVISLRGMKVSGSARIEGATYLARQVKLPWNIPPGYHQLELEAGETYGSMFLISAPRRAFQHEQDRTWGTFLPLYCLNSSESWGAGDFGDLDRLMAWTASQGGSYTGTLPLLPAFLDDPFLPGPYSPVSRLFWNEFYIDIPSVPEYAASEPARALVKSPAFQDDLASLRSGEHVDYRHGMQLRRSVLEKLLATLIEQGGGRYAEFQEWLDSHLHARLYAAFRALCEQHGAAPSGWPEPLKPEVADPTRYDQDAYNYHAYVQWIADQQIADLPRLPDDHVGLYLDLPIGVHGDGYDVWREPEAFASGFSVGAPPDLLGADGQNWGFPPLHPQKLREDGYRHFIEIIRHHMRHASLLRVDHIMGLHRLFWIPEGGEPKDGVYVHYPADDLYAILTLESHCNQTELIGEDLGTVPTNVRPMMTEHGISRMIIVPFEVWEESTSLDDIPENALTALNTHDMPPFAGVCQQWFNDERQATLVTLLKEEGRISEDDAGDLDAIVAATLEHLGTSNARTVLVNIEDLWLETESQNIPGTTDDEHMNWRRKASQQFERFSNSTSVTDTLARLNAARGSSTDED